MTRPAYGCGHKDGVVVHVRTLTARDVFIGDWWRRFQYPMAVAFVPDAVVAHAVAVIAGKNHNGIVSQFQLIE